MQNLKSVAKLYEEHFFEVLPYDDKSGGHSWWENQGCHDFELDCFKELTQFSKIASALEVGSFVGVGSIKLFENISSLKRLVCVDPWLWSGGGHKGAFFQKPFDQFCSNILHKGLSEYIFPWRTTSTEAAKTNKESFDLIHIDGIHDFDNVLMDLTLWEPFLEKNGILGGDDWLPHGPQNNIQNVERNISLEGFVPYGDVQKAVKMFLNEKNKYKLNTSQNYFWLE